MGIKKWRVKAGLSITELANAAGIKRRRLYEIETGRGRIASLKQAELAEIAKLLKCTVKDLTGRTIGVITPCRTTRLEPEVVEKMLTEQYGNKLQPLNPSAKPPVNYRLITNDSYDDGVEIDELIGGNVVNSD